MVDFSVTRADLIGAAEAGKARGAPAGELRLAPGQEVDDYVNVENRTQVPSFSTGKGPSLEQMKKELVIIEIEEWPEEIKSAKGEVIDTKYVQKTRVINPGDPDHPFVTSNPNPTEKEAECPSPSPSQSLSPGPNPGPNPSQMPLSPTSNGESAVVQSVLPLLNGLLQTQQSMMETLMQWKQGPSSPGLDSTGPSQGSLPSSEASDSEPETSRENPSSSPSQNRSSEPEMPPTRPNGGRKMEAKTRITWQTRYGRFTCRCVAASVQALSNAGGSLFVVVYRQDQENVFIPAISEDILLVEVEEPDSGSKFEYQVQSSGLNFSLALDEEYQFAILSLVEQQ